MNLHEKRKRFHYIDALRGFSFLSVLCVHVAQTTQLGIGRNLTDSGQYGVQMFFIISSLTLTRAFLTDTTPNNIFRFYVRRFLRIAPLFWTAAVFYFLITLPTRENSFQINSLSAIAQYWRTPVFDLYGQSLGVILFKLIRRLVLQRLMNPG